MVVFQKQVRTAIVTGAAGGIGANHVLRLRKQGTSVVAVDLNPNTAELYADDPGIFPVGADMSDEGAAADVAAKAESRFGPVDQLFHAVGIMPGGTISDTSSSDILRVMTVNYASAVNMIKAVLPSMQAHGSGQIIVLGSITGYVPSIGFSAYSASKAALNALVETLAYEERDHGIQVLLVAPNAVKTSLLNQAAGAPGIVAKWADGSSKLMLSSTDDVLDDIERGLKRGKVVVTPGGRPLYHLRRFFPRAVWPVAKAFAQ